MRLAVRMRVRLDGTGPSDGLPVAGCGCVTCRAATVDAVRRAPLRAVVDGGLVLSTDGPVTESDLLVELVGDGAWAVSSGAERLLWSPGGEVPAGVGASYDLVLLGMGDGLRSWPLRVAELRRSGVVTRSTLLCAVAAGHAQPPPSELDGSLALWGATAPRDGTVLDTAAQGSVQVRPSRVLVVGGARSGKSAYAELRLAAEPDVVYVATAPPQEDDAEWALRVQAHVERRPSSWRTIETGDVVAALACGWPVLVDDLGLWLVRLLDGCAAWTDALPPEVPAACDQLVAAWAACETGAVLVVPEVGSGVVPATASGRLFRDLLGSLASQLAQQSDEVVQVVAGLPRRLR